MTDERALPEALRGLVEHPHVPEALAERVAAAYGRRRRRRAGATVAAVAAVVGAVVVVPALARTPRTLPHVATSPTPDGPLVAASGTVLAVPGRPVLFCPPGARTGWPPPTPEPPGCYLNVPVVGADLDDLTGREERGGTVWGEAHLTGVYAGGTLTVTDQGPPRQPAFEGGDGAALPCPEPPGGWLPNDGAQPSTRPAEDYADEHPGTVVHLRYANPEPGRSIVVVLTEGDPEPVERALRPAYGDRVCVLRSRYTRAEVAAARAATSPSRVPALSGGGYGASPDGQVRIGLHALAPSPEVDALLAAHPPGLIGVTYWLAPAG